MQRKISGLVAGSVITSVLLIGSTAFAQTAAPTALPQGHGGWGRSDMMGRIPGVFGAVSAVNGATLTITDKSNVTYTVDATSATIEKADAASTISNVAVGDNVIVQGTVNGTSITATSVIDSGAALQPSATGTTTGAPRAGRGGFMGMIGGFFQHMFGFF